MPQARGIDLVAALYEEATYGVDAGLTVGKKMFLKSFGLRSAQNLIDSETLGGGRARFQPSKGNLDAAGDISAELAAEWMGPLFKHALGVVDTTGAGPYQHVFTIGNLPVGLTLEKDMGSAIAGVGRYERFNGCRVGSLALDFPVEGYASGTFTMKGRTSVLDDAPIDASLQDDGHTPFTTFDATVLEEGGVSIAYVQSARISLDNDLDDSVFVIGGQGLRRALPEGFAAVTGEITALFESAALLEKAIAGTETSLNIVLSRGTGDGSDGNEYMKFLVQQMKYERTSPPVEGPRGLLITLPFKAYRSDDGADNGLEVTIKNAVATV